MYHHTPQLTVWLLFNLLQVVIVAEIVQNGLLALLVMLALLVFSILILERIQNVR